MTADQCVVLENIPIPGEEHSKFWGGGFLKTKIFKGKYEPKLEFPEEGGGGIFWNITILH